MFNGGIMKNSKNGKAGAFIAIGVGAGTAIGVATGNIAMGVALGVAFGVALAAIAGRRQDGGGGPST